jgi:large subunit ribosomal protein L17
MIHSNFGRKLSRTTNERKRLMHNLVRDMVIHGRIKTTIAKAKAVQPLVEKIITNAKKGTNAGVNEVRKILTDKDLVKLLLDDAKTRFADRKGGYTRIIKLDTLRSDATQEVIFSFVDERIVVQPVIEKKTKESKVTQKNIKKTVPPVKTVATERKEVASKNKSVKQK